MIRQFIGSSNVYRTYKHCDFAEYHPYKMMNCTSKEVFAVALNNIAIRKSKIIIAVVENFLCEAIKKTSVTRKK
jgi:hypothetical protein